MEGYLGTEDVDFALSTNESISRLITVFGGIDGAHHKDWLLDQVMRLVHGGVLDVKRAKWENGHTELRYGDVTTTDAYWEWRHSLEVCDDENCECHDDTSNHVCYPYDEGTPP